MSARLRFHVQEDGSRLLAKKILLGNEFVTISISSNSLGYEYHVMSLTTGETLLTDVDITVAKLQKKLKLKLEELGVVFDTEVRQKRGVQVQPEMSLEELLQ